MGKDVILDRYGRLYEIPFQLARLGHQVRGFCLSYQGHEEGEWIHDTEATTLRWESKSLGRSYLPAVVGYPSRLLQRLRSYNPDIVIGASDIPHIVMGAWLAKRLQAAFVADLYDNFEGFGHARFPGMVRALRHAVRGAGMVLTTSEPLRTFVMDTYQPRGVVTAMPSSVNKAVFHPQDRLACRRALGLPADAQLIGTAGGLQIEKGIVVLYDAWKLLYDKHSDLHLVLAGQSDDRVPLPDGVRVHYLGNLPHERVAQLFCALDVGVICIEDTRFGRYSFPQKAYEMLACKLPVVAADVGAMRDLLAETPQVLYQAGNADDLAERLSLQVLKPVTPKVPVDDWAKLVGSIETQFNEIVVHRCCTA